MQTYSSVDYKYDVSCSMSAENTSCHIELSANWDSNLVQRTPAAEKARSASTDVADIR